MWIRWIVGFALASAALLGQDSFPPLDYRLDADWPRLPVGMNFLDTPSVAVDREGKAYVFHRGQEPILVFNPAGDFERTMGKGLFPDPHGLRFDAEGFLWAVDRGNHYVLKMDPKTERVRMVLGRRARSGDTEQLFDQPTDVAFGPNGEIYVSDGYGNSRVVKYSKEGRFLTQWGKKGKADGEFDLPHSVAVDRNGRVYVADRENYRIQVFDSDGKFLEKWTDVGSPWGLFLTGDQELYMADGYNSRVLKLDLTGRVLGSLGEFGKLPGQFHYVHHLSVGPSGAIYTGEIINMRPQRFLPR